MLELNAALDTLEHDLKTSQDILIPDEDDPIDEPGVQLRMTYTLAQKLSQRYQQADDIEKKVRDFQCKTSKSQEPAYKLHEATAYARAKSFDLEGSLAKVKLTDNKPFMSNGKTDRDQRITLGARLLYLRLRRIVLDDKFAILRNITRKAPDAPSYGILESPAKYVMPFFPDCLQLIEECNNHQLPKLAVEATLEYAHMIKFYNSPNMAKEEEFTRVAGHHETAKRLLQAAQKLCEQPFQGASILSQTLERYSRLLGKDFYEPITKAEIDAIKQAMLGDREGIATHSGHWYNCVNGHPVRSHRRPNKEFTNSFSLPLGSAVCLWNELVVLSVVRPSVDRITLLSPELRVPRLWRIDFSSM
jgi:hypothetical protein